MQENLSLRVFTQFKRASSCALPVACYDGYNQTWRWTEARMNENMNNSHCKRHDATSRGNKEVYNL